MALPLPKGVTSLHGSAWVPKQMSTGDRTILGRISSRMRCTDRKLTPTAFANRRPVQCSLLAAAGQVPGQSPAAR